MQIVCERGSEIEGERDVTVTLLMEKDEEGNGCIGRQRCIEREKIGPVE